jgi:serine O-acetyltransferase
VPDDRRRAREPSGDVASSWSCFRSDLDRYFRYTPGLTPWQRARLLVRTEALWSIAAYRLGRYLRSEAPGVVRALAKLPYAFASDALRLVVGIYIDPAARVGPGLYIGHSGGIWVTPGAVIGRDCNISQGVTIGVGGTVRRGSPTIGDRVWIGPNATVSGPIRIGDGAVIGANSLAVSHVPENGVAVGVPARIVSFSGSRALV